MTIGFNKNKYPEQRNIIHKVATIEYVKVRNYKRIVMNGLHNLKGLVVNQGGLTATKDPFYFNDFDLNRVDLLHLFNYISYGRTPWVATFETILPRFETSHSLIHAPVNTYTEPLVDPSIIKALDQLAGPACKRIIGLSECSVNMQKTFLSHFPAHFPKIVPKLLCLHPPQALMVNSWEEKALALEGDLHFMFVGGQFFGKGGREVLEVFQELRTQRGYPIQLTIVSSLTTDAYASNTSETDVEKAKGFIANHKDWISYYKSLPNPEVLRLMQKAHVGLLPTYADTYGYSVLEFQASGCPVISTNVRALPEINNDEVGWILPVRTHPSGEGYYATDTEREAMRSAISTGLRQAITEIFDNRAIIVEKANKAIQHIKTKHSPKDFSDTLLKLYIEATTGLHEHA
ncbi:glycosyltransferase involved in cell wall biosynthesis [Flavobacteriaceae bacterium MAR_2010_72]|nr:glycosyltransferase involved in cell wall biosynthesis [Flavobacteriaceae bacterium MAR_2010_72]